MMKFALLVAFAAVALAGPVCTELVNADFDASNTVAPWQNNSYLGGSSSCHNENYNSNNRCQLLQQNAVSGAFLSNSGRISVGYPSRAGCRPEDQSTPVGFNVYQTNIGLCRGVKIKADVGFQDASNNPAAVRADNIFSIVVGRDEFALMGSQSTVASHTFTVPGDRPFNLFTSTTIEGTWNGPEGDSCSPICPESSCFAVGVRYARADVVRTRVRGYIDNLEIIDESVPTIVANDVSGVAVSCGGTATVTFDVTATDLCCGSVALSYSWDSGSTTAGSAEFPVGTTVVTVTATKTDASLTNTATFNVVVSEPAPTITCTDYSADTQTCWTQLPPATALATASSCGGSITYSPTLDSPFPNGLSIVTASITQTDGQTTSCTSNVVFTLCCESTPPVTKRSAPASLRKLAKF